MVFIPNTNSTPYSSSAVQDRMLSYIEQAVENADSKYTCRVNSDQRWISYGIARVLHSHGSGREFFQDLRMESLGEMNIKRQDFQEGLKSNRRLAHLTSINNNYLTKRSQTAWKQKNGGFCESLDAFHIYAADGHFHAASSHEERDFKGKKNAIGHLYALNLRTRDMSHLALSSDGRNRKPNDIGVLKRMGIDALKQGSQQGQKLLYVWDRACIDFIQWMKWKHNNGIYFLTRTKDNMNKEVCGNIPFDRHHTENLGVIANQYISASGAEMLRMVTYDDLQTGERLEFVTNLHHSIEPGLIVQLYRMRWDIEKVFDDFKNKLGEKKAWANSLTGKRMQAQFLILTYNLMLRLREDIETKEEVSDPAQTRESEKLWGETKQIYAAANRAVPYWLEKLRRTTQIGVKFIRWCRALFLRACPWKRSLELLAHEYSLN